MLDYISLDIETLGLPKDRVLPPIIEVGAIYDKVGLGELPYSEEALLNSAFHVYVLPESSYGYQTVDPFAASMNYKILEQIAKAKLDEEGTLRAPNGTRVIHPEKLLIVFSQWLHMLGLVEAEILEDNQYGEYDYADASVIDYPKKTVYLYKNKLTFAGKNVAGFDLPIMDNSFGFYHLPRRHRVIDPGSMFLSLGDDKIPDLAECCRRVGIDDNITHTAVEDALKVVRVIRAHLNNMHNLVAITKALQSEVDVSGERKGKAITQSSATA